MDQDLTTAYAAAIEQLTGALAALAVIGVVSLMRPFAWVAR